MGINFASWQHDPTRANADRAALARLTPLQNLYLDRLRHIVRKIHLHGRYLAATDRRMQLLNRAALSSFCSCRELGIEGEARTALAKLRSELVLPPASGRERSGSQAG